MALSLPKTAAVPSPEPLPPPVPLQAPTTPENNPEIFRTTRSAAPSAASSPLISPASNNPARRVRLNLQARHRARNRDPFHLPPYLSPFSVPPDADSDVCRSQFGGCTKYHRPGQHYPLDPRDVTSISARLTERGPGSDRRWKPKRSTRRSSGGSPQRDVRDSEQRRDEILENGEHAFYESRSRDSEDGQTERGRSSLTSSLTLVDGKTPRKAERGKRPLATFGETMTLEARHKMVEGLDDPFVDMPETRVAPGGLLIMKLAQLSDSPNSESGEGKRSCGGKKAQDETSLWS